MFNFLSKGFESRKKRLPILLKGREKLEFKIPSLFSNDQIMFEFLDACKYFEIETPIKCTFGSIRSSWNGGRSSIIKNFNADEAASIIKKYNEYGISTCFTFTNYYITKDMLDDFVGNTLLEIASENENNYAIVSSDIIADYIREKYPKIKLESSLLRPTYEFPNYTETPKYYDDLCEKFDKVMIRPEFGQDLNYLRKIKNKDKIDILVNSNCVYKCPFSIKHYDRAVLLEKGEMSENTLMCNRRFLNKDSIHKNNIISNSEIDKIAKLGFNKFKLAGRNINPMLFLHVLGTYIFDSSGVFQHILNYLYLKEVLVKNNKE